MTLVSLGAPIGWPPSPPSTTSSTFAANLSLDAAGEYGGVVTQVPRTGTIDRIACRFNNITTGGDVVFKVETVNTADSEPSGTLYHANATKTVAVVTGDADTVVVATFATPFAVTQGDVIAIMIESAAASAFNGQVQETNAVVHFPPTYGGFPYWIQEIGGTFGDDDTGGMMSLRYDDGEWTRFPGCVLFTNAAVVAYNSGDTPDEHGIKFTAPVGMNVKGVWWMGGAANDYTIKLYDSGDTLLESLAVDKDQAQNTGFRLRCHYFDTDVELTKDAVYRATLLPGAGDITPYQITVPVAAMLETLLRGGVQHTERTDAGGWTDTSTETILMGLIIDQVDVPVGGGGGIKLVGVGGGLVG